MTKEALDSKLESWIAASPRGSGKRYYSKLHPELDDELEYTIRRATMVSGKPIAYEKKFLTDSLSDQIAKKSVDDLHKLTMLLDRFDDEYQTILDNKSFSNGLSRWSRHWFMKNFIARLFPKSGRL